MKPPRQPIDAMCMTQACQGVLRDLYYALLQWAEQYDVPSGALRAMVGDVFLFEIADMQPLTPEYFAELANEIIAEQSENESDVGDELNIPVENSPETKKGDQTNNWYDLEDRNSRN
jgi:hypothetical protein